MLSQLGKMLGQSSSPRPRKRAPCETELTLDEIRKQLRVHADKGGGYGRNAARDMLAQAECGHGQQVVDDLIREFNLEATFDFRPGSSFLSERA